MSKVLQERGLEAYLALLKQTREIKSSRSQLLLKLIHTRYAVLDPPNTPYPQNRTLMYETRQMTILFPSLLNGYYCEEKKGLYGPQFSKAHFEASQSIPQKEKDPGTSISVDALYRTKPYLRIRQLVHTKVDIEMPIEHVKYPKGITENILVGIGKFVFPIDFIILDMPEDIKVPLILKRPFLSTTAANPNERMELDLEARLVGETLVLKRSLDPFLEDYIELNDLNEPLELMRNQGDDLMPTIEEGELIEELRTRDDELNTKN
ncbi:hypothetical protein Tco_1073288 [Tanacetum coccineum]